jgi:hypothetical protein
LDGANMSGVRTSAISRRLAAFWHLSVKNSPRSKTGVRRYAFPNNTPLAYSSISSRWKSSARFRSS